MDARILWLFALFLLVLFGAAWLLRALAYRRRLRSLSGDIARYAEANRALRASPAGRIVLFGDELAERWDIERDFPELALVNRGISGETTLHLLARFRQDVIGLRPRIAVLLGGAHDPAWGLPLAATQDHFQLMARLAVKEQIDLVIGSLVPARRGRFAPRPSASYVATLNDWLRRFAQAQGLAFADFHAALADRDGRLRTELTNDGWRPNAAGYRAMAAVLCKVLERLMVGAGPRPRRAATS